MIEPFENFLNPSPEMKKMMQERKAKNLEIEARMEQMEKECRREKIQRDWNAPKRHSATKIEPDSVEWTQAFDKLKSKLGNGALITLLGKRGSGKTQMAVEAMRHLLEPIQNSKYVSAVEFFMQIKNAYRKDSEESEMEIMENFEEASLLVIDEFGKRSDSDWERVMLFELIDKRYGNLKDTILISNLDALGFSEFAGESIMSRLNETGGIIECNWKSFRE